MLHTKIHKSSLPGFTLIELMIVIVILAILAVVVMVAINPAQRIASANNSRVKSDLSSIGSSAMQYATDNGYYPAAFGGGAGGASPNEAAWTVTSSPAEATGTLTIVVPASCTITNSATCTSMAVYGTSYNDGVADTTKVYCWQSKTGQIVNTLTAANCIP